MDVSSLQAGVRKPLRQILLSPIGEPTKSPTWASPWVYRSIPDELLGDGDKQGNAFVLQGNEAEAYWEIVELLRGFRASEHLSDKEKQQEVWRLVCKSLLDRDALLKDGAALTPLIDEFLDRTSSDLLEYEFFFELDVEPVEFKPFSIETVGFRYLTTGDFLAMGFKDSWVGKAETLCVASTTEQGTSVVMAEGRARERVKKATDALSFINSHSLVLHDWQLVYAFGLRMFYRRQKDGITGRGATRRRFRPNFLQTIDDKQLKVPATAIEAMRTLSPSIQESLRIALHWFAQSLATPDYDGKVLCLCTALESVLTTKSDQRKGERLAFRSVALMFEFSKGTIWPGAILDVYEVRSRLVHGSGIGLSDLPPI